MFAYFKQSIPAIQVKSSVKIEIIWTKFNVHLKAGDIPVEIQSKFESVKISEIKFAEF